MTTDILRLYFDTKEHVWVVSKDRALSPNTFKGKVLRAFECLVEAVEYCRVLQEQQEEYANLPLQMPEVHP